ncbi:MAG: Glycosyl transferase family 39 [Microgenomates group bacterium GW2011_GWC1_37_8]|uniref:Glycosyl transferase family 39 n=1 Tax=Candidatus Woesebacteria bacterium GW2011_GWB1_38_8 TaxID=1618570 RepID=A0A0G0NII2_9BACT|nr:MAG: Glycosyl transferase family 39 [Microgenomates group bacterium GW2011_GWC1_37_8]KKQ85694.1 MAG: Glycosyl transferase family 39 [Candidatus Woesebacteria bacterium GW2011_GWB1_38_8]
MQRIIKLLNKYIDQIKRINNIEYIILSLMLTLGLIVRLYKINSPIADWHSFRQADTASVTRTFVDKGINIFIPKYHDVSRVQSGLPNPQGYRFVEFPLYNAIHAILVKNAPIFTLEVWGRLLSIFSALLTSFFIFLIGKKLYGKWYGLTASFFYLILPFNIYFTRTVLPEPMAIMFALASLWFFLIYTEKSKVFYLYLSSLSLSFGILIKPYVIFYGVVLVYYFYNKFGIRNLIRKKDLIISLLIILLPFIAWRIWMQHFPEGIPFWKWTFNGDGIRFRPAFWRWIFGERLGYLILGIWGLVPFIFGILSLKKKDWLLIASLIGSFLYVATFATANVRHDYYQVLVIPALCFTLASGVLTMWNGNYFNKIVCRLILILSLFLALLIGATEAREFYKINRPEIVSAGEAVDRLTAKNSLVIAAYNGDTAFLYQTKRLGWPVVELPINELIQEGAEYYASVNFNDPQTQEFMEKFDVIEKTDKYVVIKLK